MCVTRNSPHENFLNCRAPTHADIVEEDEAEEEKLSRSPLTSLSRSIRTYKRVPLNAEKSGELNDTTDEPEC